MKTWFAVLLLMGLPVGYGQGAVHFQITGTVVNDRNGEPIPFCRMSASPAFVGRMPGNEGFGARQEAREVEADAKGRFALEVPAEGRYRLSASARGFRTQMLEAHGTFSTAVVLTKAAPAYAVVFRASADAVIAGEVTDEAGEGVRQAQVRLYSVGDPYRTNEERRLQMRSTVMTDDRGHYELPAMPAGSYKLSVAARPWYATQNVPLQTGGGGLDPSLDVVYPTTWYPGAEDENGGEAVEVKYGEKRRMDVHLHPVASGHLRMTIPVVQPTAGGAGIAQGPFQRRPQLERILPDGTTEFVAQNIQIVGRDGLLDIGGLIPGTYRVAQQTDLPDSTQTFSTVHLAAGGTADEEKSAVPQIPVAIRVDGDANVTAGQVSLTDTATGQVVGRRGGRDEAGPRGRRGGVEVDEATLQVSPGTYEVMLDARDSFVAGVSGTGAQVTGRVVKIVEGSPHLLVHVAAGLSSIEGIATRMGKPSSGALVLLVPATLGDPSSLAFERRAQTATDGSFQLVNVIPGQYIVLAIDHGWGVNWRDATTLRSYLLQGEPLDLKAAATAHPVVKAVAP